MSAAPKPNPAVAIGIVVVAIAAIPAGAALLVMTKHELSQFLGILIALGGVFVLYSQWSDNYAHADRVEQVFLMPTDGGVLVIEDLLALMGGTVGMAGIVHQYRVTSRRLSDGARLGHVTNEVGLRVLGAAPDFLWCTSRDMPVHTRHPATLEVIHDTRAVVGTTGIELAHLEETDRPIFDPRTRGVHAFARDGRGYSITPELQVTEAARSTVKRGPTPKRANEGGGLHITQVLEPEPGWPRPQLGMRPASASPRARELLTLRTADGKTQWEVPFRANTISRAYHLCVTSDRVVLVLGPSESRRVGSGYRSTSVGGEEGYTAVGIVAATGVIAWRTRV